MCSVTTLIYKTKFNTNRLFNPLGFSFVNLQEYGMERSPITLERAPKMSDHQFQVSLLKINDHPPQPLQSPNMLSKTFSGSPHFLYSLFEDSRRWNRMSPKTKQPLGLRSTFCTQLACAERSSPTPTWIQAPLRSSQLTRVA